MLYIGLLLSIIIATLLILQKKKINMLYNIESQHFNLIEFNDVQFSLIVTNNNGYEIKNYDRLYDLKCNYMDYKIQNNTPKLTVKQINLTECKDNSNKTGAYNDSKTIGAFKNSSRCLNLKENNITIYGNDKNSIESFSIINFYLNKCLNTTTKKDCLPNEIIEKELSSIKLSMSIGDYEVNTLNQNDPFLAVKTGYLMDFSASIHSKHFFEINNIEFFSDDGIIFEDIKKYSSYRIYSEKQSVKLGLGNLFFPTTFGNISLRGSGYKEIYNRSYQKLPDLIPQIISFYQVYIIIMKAIIIFFTSGSLEESFFSLIFNLKELEEFKNTKEKISYKDILRKEYLLRNKEQKANDNKNLRSEEVLNINNNNYNNNLNSNDLNNNINNNNLNDLNCFKYDNVNCYNNLDINRKLKNKKFLFNADQDIEIANRLKKKSILGKKFQQKNENSFNENENENQYNHKNIKKNSKKFFDVHKKKFKEELKEESKSQNQNINSIFPLQTNKQ
jgi:hypothetical protein